MSILVYKLDGSLTSQSLPGFGVKTERYERKRPIERQQKERNSSSLFSLLLTVMMDKQII